jgi:DNA mismatch endonuclease (patch repair protein)
MRANRRTDTKPELALRHALHRLGYRYRKDYRLDLDSGRRVRPDIAFTARKVAVFVDGCFWHACPEHGSKPRANEWYWGPKLVRNVERDRINDAALILAGWSVIRLWEHVPLEEAVRTVVAAITAPNPATAPDSAATSDSAAAATSNPATAPNPATASNPVAAPDPAAAVSDPAAAPDQANPADAASSDDPSKPIPPAADDSLG